MSSPPGADNALPDKTAEVDSHVASTCSPNPSDLGTVQSASSLPDEQKYHILSSIPSTLKSIVISGVTNHAVLSSFLGFGTLHHWMVVFCGPCFLFSQVRFNSKFVSTPFRNWKNAVGTFCGLLNRHSQSQAHKQCVELLVSFITVMEKNKQSIKSQLSEAYDKQVQLNTRALLLIFDSMQFLIKQGLGLRGIVIGTEIVRERMGTSPTWQTFSVSTVLISMLISTVHPKMQGICHLRSRMSSLKSMVPSFGRL